MIIIHIFKFLFYGLITLIGFIAAITSITFLAETNNPIYGLGIIGGVLITSIGIFLETKRQTQNDS
jgi:hypothetical membrane protein